MTGRIQKIVGAIQMDGRLRRLPRASVPPAPTRVLCSMLVLLTCTLGVASNQVPTPDTSAPSDSSRLRDVHRDARSLLDEADRQDAPVSVAAAALTRLATALDALAADPAAGEVMSLPDRLRSDVRAVAERLRQVTAASATAPAALAASRQAHDVTRPVIRALLDRMRAALAGEVALGLTFQGTYSQTRAPEPVYGGHATAMGPAPAPAPAGGGATAPVSPVTFEVAARLPTHAWAGGPTKDHILESAGNGIALIDYDDDGWLDVYVVTAPQLTPTREPIAHRNALYRNRGGWQFENVSARAGVDAAAWGSGVCAGDADGDGRIDLYVTNWGPNLLFRNKGTGRSRRSRHVPVSQPVAGARAARSSTPMATATWISMWPATSRRVGTTCDAPAARSSGGMVLM